MYKNKALQMQMLQPKHEGGVFKLFAVKECSVWNYLSLVVTTLEVAEKCRRDIIAGLPQHKMAHVVKSSVNVQLNS
jgi:hypothetical protein